MCTEGATRGAATGTRHSACKRGQNVTAVLEATVCQLEAEREAVNAKRNMAMCGGGAAYGWLGARRCPTRGLSCATFAWTSAPQEYATTVQAVALSPNGWDGVMTYKRGEVWAVELSLPSDC
jgi:hypothetical protein